MMRLDNKMLKRIIWRTLGFLASANIKLLYSGRSSCCNETRRLLCTTIDYNETENSYNNEYQYSKWGK